MLHYFFTRGSEGIKGEKIRQTERFFGAVICLFFLVLAISFFFVLRHKELHLRQHELDAMAMDRHEGAWETFHSLFIGELFLISFLGILSLVVLANLGKRLIERLKAEENIKIILEKVPFGVIVIGKDRIIRWVNQWTAGLSGAQNANDLIGKKCSEFCPGDEDICPFFDKGEDLDKSECVLRRFDGVEIPILKTVKKIYFNKEEVVLETFVDISEQKRMEAVLRGRKEQYRLILDHSSDFIFSIDTEGYFNYISPSWEKESGYEISKLIGQNFLTLIHPDDIERCRESLVKTAQSRGVVETPDVRVRYPDGSYHWQTARGVSVFGDDGKVSSFVVVSRDITKIKSVQSELLKRQEELVQEREVAIKSSEEARAASEAKSAFFANISHEVRTPLNSIIGFIKLLRKTQLNEKQLRYAENILWGGEVLLAIINNILEFEKSIAGKLVLDCVNFNLNELVKNIYSMVTVIASGEGKQIGISYEIREDVPLELRGDDLRIKQIILNLLNNAIKFTEKGSVKLSVELNHEDGDAVASEDNCRLLFTVEDTGIGIPEALHGKIFQPFTQVDGSTRRKYSGTGLGLAISSAYVRMMGGRIWLESEVDKGSRFMFTILVKKQAT
ncbi:MAG: PAS domain S-box protein [Candidatus Omnitrophota bacterium]